MAENRRWELSNGCGEFTYIIRNPGKLGRGMKVTWLTFKKEVAPLPEGELRCVMKKWELSVGKVHGLRILGK